VPTVASWDRETFDEAGERLGLRLYPLGDYGEARAYLAIGSDCAVYMLHDSIWRVGGSIDQAIIALVRGDALNELVD
jgi:hypothetical protein